MKFNSVKSKCPLFAALLLLGGAVCVSVLADAQTAQASGWEEVNTSDAGASQLLAAPPHIAVNNAAQVQNRPPLEVPGGVFENTNEFYTVQAGDTLPKIALKVYGDANKWQDLMVLNNIENGSRIVVGQKLAVSSTNSSVPEAHHTTVAAANDTETDVEVPEHVINETEPSVSADAGYYGQSETYTVRRGDTLGGIAKRVLGSTQKWREIARANPSINPNRLNVGDVLVMPSANVPEGYEVALARVEAKPLSSEPWQTAAMNMPQTHTHTAAAHNTAVYAAPAAAESVSEPSFDQTPLMAPPPPPPAYGMGAPYGSAPYAAANPYGAPPAYGQGAGQMYAGGAMSAPPSAMPSVQAPPPPPSGPYMSVPPIAPTPAAQAPNKTSTMYREEKYRLPDELKTTDYSPYFVNINGYHGLYEVESALLPYMPTWHFGAQLRYDHLEKINSIEADLNKGSALIVPISLLYTGKKFYAGATIPFQDWEVKDSGDYKANLSGLANCSLKAGYQVWKNLEGSHAVTVHAEAKFSSDNHHRPIFETGFQEGKTKDDSVMGPSGTTKNAEIQVGAAYSGVMNDRWATHINLNLAQVPTDDISKFTIRGGMDYRVNRHFSLVGELNSTSYDLSNVGQAIYNDTMPSIVTKQKDSGTSVDFILGLNVYNERWSGMLGFPIALQNDIGYGHDFGVIFGLNHRWD